MGIVLFVLRNLPKETVNIFRSNMSSFDSIDKVKCMLDCFPMRNQWDFGHAMPRNFPPPFPHKYI